MMLSLDHVVLKQFTPRPRRLGAQNRSLLVFFVRALSVFGGADLGPASRSFRNWAFFMPALDAPKNGTSAVAANQ
jgi:hypothetical protein